MESEFIFGSPIRAIPGKKALGARIVAPRLWILEVQEMPQSWRSELIVVLGDYNSSGWITDALERTSPWGLYVTINILAGP